MSTEQSEHAPSRVVVASTILLAVAIFIVGALVLFDDVQDRRDQQAAFDATTEEALVDDFEVLRGDIERSLNTADQAGRDLALAVGEIGDSSGGALSAAVIESEVVQTVRALDQVVYQNGVGEVFGVDRFGSSLDDATNAGFDVRVAIARSVKESFVDRQGQNFMDDGIAAYYPVGENASQGWVVLILRGNDLAVDSTFSRIGRVGETESSTVFSEDIANLTVALPFADSEFVAVREVTLVQEAAPGWFSFILKAAATLVALTAAMLLGKLARGETPFTLPARQQPEPVQFGARSDFEQNIIGVVELDETGKIVSANQSYCDQVRREREDLIGTPLLALTEPADRTRHLAALDKLMTGTARTTQVEHRVATGEDDSEVWVLEHLSRTDSGDGPRILIQSQDITFRRYATWELAKQALHDELTGLANRAMLVHRLRTALSANADVETGQKPLVGVMFIDVDRFKLVNDSLGHDVGDRLLKHVGARMETAVRTNDTVSRFGGDEFVVLCDNLAGVSEAMAVAERVRSSLATPYVDNGATIHPTLSIGIAVCHAGDMAADELLRDADAAMYRAKERGRNRVEVFDEGMRKLLVEQMTLESELRTAIDTEQIAMYFQPIVDSATYATAGFEALIRWPHPTRGLLTPGQFLGVAEEAGLQSRLDTVALKKTCTQMAQWAARYPLANELYVSANKVPKNFPLFVQHIREIVASTGLPPQLLVVEVVENALIEDADGALQAIEALKDMGVRVAIDDFGTGYSSLSYLTQFRPTTLKIDRAFVSLLPEDMATASVVQAITDMALALDINVIAEGVETWEQAEVLHRMGVPYFQGYLFAKPRPADEIENWFKENEGSESPQRPIDFEIASVDRRPAGLASGGFVRKS